MSRFRDWMNRMDKKLVEITGLPGCRDCRGRAYVRHVSDRIPRIPDPVFDESGNCRSCGSPTWKSVLIRSPGIGGSSNAQTAN